MVRQVGLRQLRFGGLRHGRARFGKARQLRQVMIRYGKAIQVMVRRCKAWFGSFGLLGSVQLRYVPAL